MDKTVQDVSQPFGIFSFHQNIIYISKNWHRFIMIRVFGINEGFILMGDSLSCIGFNQCFVQKLFFLMAHIWNEQRKENVQTLNLTG